MSWHEVTLNRLRIYLGTLRRWLVERVSDPVFQRLGYIRPRAYGVRRIGGSLVPLSDGGAGVISSDLRSVAVGELPDLSGSSMLSEQDATVVDADFSAPAAVAPTLFKFPDPPAASSSPSRGLPPPLPQAVSGTQSPSAGSSPRLVAAPTAPRGHGWSAAVHELPATTRASQRAESKAEGARPMFRLSD